MSEHCEICGDYLETFEEKEDGICLNCQSSMLQEDNIDLGLGFENEDS